MPEVNVAPLVTITDSCKKFLRFDDHMHLFISIQQKLAVLLATAGAVMSMKNFNNSFNNNHQRIGVALYGIIWLQVIAGIFRPQRYTNEFPFIKKIFIYVNHWIGPFSHAEKNIKALHNSITLSWSLNLSQIFHVLCSYFIPFG